MSTDIKPGQVWASVHSESETATVRGVHDGEVQATDDQSGSYFVRAARGFVKDYRLTTPAELDPSKVKAGDTVTVSGGGTRDRPAYEITGVAWEPSHSPGTVWVGPVCISASLVTLTDHQPAPEPEPEWKPGDLAAVTSHGVGWERVKASFNGSHWYALGDTHLGVFSANAEEITPLVVIDPATVDVDALARRGEINPMLVRIVLDYIGIEVAR